MFGLDIVAVLEVAFTFNIESHESVFFCLVSLEALTLYGLSRSRELHIKSHKQHQDARCQIFSHFFQVEVSVVS